MALIKWTYPGLKIRHVYNGSVTAEWSPNAYSTGTIVRVIQCGPPQYEMVTIEREDMFYNRRPVVVGYRAHLALALMTLRGSFQGDQNPATLPAQPTLEVLLSYLGSQSYPLSYLEIALHSTDWKRVQLKGGWKPQLLSGKAVGQVALLEFIATDIQQSTPATDNGSTW